MACAPESADRSTYVATIAARFQRGKAMKSFKGAAFAIVAIALAAAAQAGAGGPRTVSSTYTVGGLTVPGVITGLVLRPGQVVTVTATGGVCPTGDAYCPGPDGNAAVDSTSIAFGGFPLPEAPAWGLVGRVGDGPWVQVGGGPTTLSGTGALVFAVNDDLLTDNTGSFTVSVSYACWPGWGYGDKNHTHCGPPGLAAKAGTPPTPQGDTCRPGWGNGDANHTHCGPPGLVGKDETPPSAGGNGNGNDNANGNGKSDAGAQADQSKGNGKGKG
jgi:hypothetical protein